MSPIRPLVLLLCGSLAALGVASAQEKASEESVEDKVEEIVEERAAEEKRDGEPSDADVGEASYNVENCDPMTVDADAEGAMGAEAGDADADGDMDAEEDDMDAEGDDADAEEGADMDGDGDGEMDDVESKDMDECEQIVK